MVEHKHPRQRGKVSFKRFFQQFKQGDSVAVVREQSEIFGYSKRMQGRTGKVLSKQGSAYCVEISDLGKPKRYFIRPVHLRRIAA
jgi:large subunit ribosomal protein L21e